MDRTTDFNTGFEVRYSTTDHRYHATLHGVEVGAGWTYIEAEAAAQAPYQVLTDAAGDPPVDIPDEPPDFPPGGEPPPDYVAALAAHVQREYTAFLAASPTAPAPSPLPTSPAGDAAANAAGSKKAAYLERAARARSAWACRVGGITVAIRHQGRIVAYHPSAYVAHLAAERLREVA